MGRSCHAPRRPGLCGSAGGEPTEAEGPSAPEWEAYREASKRAGRDPDAHVKLAVWCEAHGLADERLGHLAAAVLADPSHASARGMMGLVPFRGKWQKPEAVAERVKSDAELVAALAEYNAKRSATPNAAEAQWKLGLWCEQKGLDAEAKAHFTAVVRLDPGRDAAWKRLGYKKHNGRWMTDAQFAASKDDAEAQKKADKRWEADLSRWKGWLSKEDRRAEAEESLAGVTDPRAVPSVVKLFGASAPKRAVQLLGQIDSPGSSRVLAALAVSSPSAEARRVATETLRRRDPREYAGLLVRLIRDPIKYEVKPVGGPGSPGELLVQGKRFDVRRLYTPPAPLPVLPGDRVVIGPDGLPVALRNAGYQDTGYFHPQEFLNSTFGLALDANRMNNLLPQSGLGQAAHQLDARQQSALLLIANDHIYSHGGAAGQAMRSTIEASGRSTPFNSTTQFDFLLSRTAAVPVGRSQIEAQRAAMSAQQQLEADVAAIEAYNAPIIEANARAVRALNDATDQTLPEDRQVWTSWWVDQLGFNAVGPPTTTRPAFVEQVPLVYEPQLPVFFFDGPPVGFARISCFGAGTPVQTLTGPRPIEEVQVGDLVLAQDTATGALRFRPVLVVHRNPPSKTLRIRFEGEEVVSSTFHRFWRVGRGWAMARDLEPGDAIRTLEGPARVVAVEDGQVRPVFNLDVAEDKTFFVGRDAVLVHDNTVPGPRASRFDAPPDLAASGL